LIRGGGPWIKRKDSKEKRKVKMDLEKKSPGYGWWKQVTRVKTNSRKRRGMVEGTQKGVGCPKRTVGGV